MMNQSFGPLWPLPTTLLPVGGISFPAIIMGPVLVPVNWTSAATAS
jgi:hypothetical protein